MKIILILGIFLWQFVGAKEYLYLNYPKELPSKNSNTSFGDELIKLIKNSKFQIDFAIYGLREQEDILEALQDAKKRGVKIKGVVDSDSKGENYYKDTASLYNQFDIRSDHKSSIMHNKFFIFDKKIIWSGSSNISDTGTGGYNTNNVVVIDDERVALLYYNEFLQMYNGKFGLSKKEHHLENIKTPTSLIWVYFSPKSNTYDHAIKEIIENAKSYIYIPIFYLTHKDLANQLLKASKRGVEIKVILDASAANNKYSLHTLLRQNGILVKVENFGGKMHNKSMIVDDSYIVSGSMNFTKAGEEKNDENTIILKNTLLAKQYKKYFLDLWEMIPNRFLSKDPKPEGNESKNSCIDKIDNDFDGEVDFKDGSCFN